MQFRTRYATLSHNIQFMRILEREQVLNMQEMIFSGRSLGRIAIVVLLIIQCILGLLFSLPFLVDLLAPDRPVIVTGTSILTGPLAGAALAVALASPIIAWGMWMLKRWAAHRTLLLEIMGLVIGILAFTQSGINRTLQLALIGVAILILLCWFVDPGIRAIPSLRQSTLSTARKQA